MSMTLEQAERIRQDLGLPKGATAEEWAETRAGRPYAAIMAKLPALLEAFAVLHAAEVAKERDAARAEVERLRAAMYNASELVWQHHGRCPFCPAEDGPDGTRRHHNEGCPSQFLRSTVPQTAVPPGVPPPWVEPPGTAEPPGLRGMNAGGTA